MLRKSAIACALVVVTSASSLGAQGNVVCQFSGSGSAGVDCLGQPWFMINGEWGIPGPGFGVITFTGTGIATDFHIAFGSDGDFYGLLDNGSTVFIVSPFGSAQIWTAFVSGNNADFFAPAGAELSPGQQFFVNVAFLNGGNVNLDDVYFRAAWTNGNTVPEPATMTLLATGIAGLAAARKRRRAV